MKHAIRISLALLVALLSVVYIYLNNIPISIRGHIYSVAAAINTLALFSLLFLFGLLEITDFFGMFSTQKPCDKQSSENSNRPLSHSTGGPEQITPLRELERTRLDNGLCPLCGAEDETSHKTASARWFCLGAQCPKRKG